MNQVIYLLLVSSRYIQSQVSTSFISSHLTQVVQPRLSSSSPLQEKKNSTQWKENYKSYSQF